MLEARCCCGAWISDLARTHARRLAGIARGQGVGPEDALDIVQDAFQTLLGRPDLRVLRGDGVAAGRVLAAIVRNAARNRRRRHHHARPHVNIDGVPVAASGPSPRAALERARELARLDGCMAQLGEIHRDVVTLRVLEELSSDDVGRALGLSANHVAVLLYRARKQLERCMDA